MSGTSEPGPVRQRTVAAILSDPERCSLKRLAWAYGCAPKGSDEERQLREILLEKARVNP